MADGKLLIELSALDHEPVAHEAMEIAMPGTAGVFTVLPGHTPFLTTLTHGVIVIYIDETEKHFYAVHEGFAEVLDDRVVILADTLEHHSAIDPDRAREAQRNAQQALEETGDATAAALASTALARSIARLEAHGLEEH